MIPLKVWPNTAQSCMAQLQPLCSAALDESGINGGLYNI